MNKYTILLIGAGQLGSRHLQALVKLKEPSDIIIIDPSNEALERSESRMQEINGWDRHTCYFHQGIGELPEVDFAVVATSANIRRAVVEDVLSATRVKNMLLEKVLFQRAQDCVDVGVLLKQKGVKTWVNAPRRMWPFYRQLKVELEGESILSLKQGGGGWGMACNSYHYLDIFSYLVDDNGVSLSSNFLCRESLDSKRSGFKEITGTLCGKFDSGAVFFISDYQGHTIAPTITVETNKRIFVIDEINQSIIPISGKALLEGLIPEPKYQSELTHLVVEEVILSGSCPLTSFEEASLLHQKMLNAFAVCFPQSKERSLICPIT